MQPKTNKHAYQIFSCIKSVKAINKLIKFEYCNVQSQQTQSLFHNTLKCFYLFFY